MTERGPQDVEPVSNEVPPKEEIDRERYEVLEQLDEWLETPLVVLGFAWLVLLVVDLIWGLGPFLQATVTVIWILFVVDFIIRFLLAPAKIEYLKKNWLTAVSLLVPALRVFRIVRIVRLLRVARAARGLRLFRIVSSLNRGMHALRASMGRRGFGYVLALTVVVIFVGAAGMWAFEGTAGFENYGDALWWTAMLLTTIGSQYWPITAEGRLLTFLLSVYGLAVFGYLTATLATYFIGRDAENDEAEIAGTRSIEALRTEIKALRAELAHLSPEEAHGGALRADES